MNNNWRKLLMIVLAIAILATSSVVVFAANSTNDTEVILTELSLNVISENSSMPNICAQTESAVTTNTTINENYLFKGSTIESVLDHASDIKDMIKKGSLFAVYNEEGIDQNYEDLLGFPIGFADSESAQKNTPFVTIGKIYYTDANGYPCVARYNVDPNKVTESTYTHFLNYIDSRVIDSKASQHETTLASTNSVPLDFIGTIADAFEGSSNKGNMEVVHEVATAQEVSGYDYYVIHSFIDATPGDALYNNGYDLDAFTARLLSYTTDAFLYKTGPNTMNSATTYNVDIGFTGSKNGAEANFVVGWSRTIPDVNIAKVKDNDASCTWTVNINDWLPAANSTISFEPGGTFRVPESNERLLVTGKYTLTVDCAWDAPSLAIPDATSAFFCESNRVW